MRDTTRERAITNIIQGLIDLRLLESMTFRVLSVGGACWSNDVVQIEDSYFGAPASSAAKHMIETNLRRSVLSRLEEAERGEQLTTALPHRIVIEWHDKLPTDSAV